MKNILNRKSIRRYTNRPVEDELIKQLLRAAMAAPSAVNEQSWEFVVVKDKKILNSITEIHPYAQMLKEASVAIIVCGDENKEVFKGFWVEDCSAAAENILIAAEPLGLGAVWVGVYPIEERVKALQNILLLPENIKPLCIVPVGYPGEEKQPVNRYDEEKIHINKW